MTSSPVSFEQIAALVDGQLSPEEQAVLRARIMASPQAATLAWLERVVGLMRADNGFDPPPTVRVRAANLISRSARLPATRTRIAGALRFDSRTQPLAFGIRSGITAVRQLLFNAGERDIDLRVTPSGERFVVAGQVLGPEEPGMVALRGEATTAEAQLNALAEFVLPPVPAGKYILVLALESAEVVIDDLDVGAF